MRVAITPPAADAPLSLVVHRGRLTLVSKCHPDVNLFDAVAAHLRSLTSANKRTVIAAWSVTNHSRDGGLSK